MTVGETIDGRFVLLSEAGSGGMGTVYRARDATDGSFVALKLLEPEASVDLLRFDREAEVLRRIEHENVVRYVAHGRSRADQRGFIAMEWLEGETLAERLLHPPIPVRDALRAVRSAAYGLGAAHAIGIVHRDVKPANIMLVDGDPRRAKILDFGIARTLSRGHTLTQTGQVVGTPFYMAPEQARASDGVDARADVYALGAVLYHLLAGRPPFQHEHLMAVLAAILLEPAIPLRERAPSVPVPVADFVMELLEKDPNERPPDANALAERLLAVENDSPILRSLPSRAPPALTQKERRLLCLVLAAGRFHEAQRAATLAPGELEPLERVRAAVEAQGGSIEILVDGSIVARVDDAGTPTDQAIRAAHIALAIRQILPETPLAAVAGHGRFDGAMPVGEVIDRGGALLSRAIEASTLTRGNAEDASSAFPRALAIRVDDVLQHLLTGRFRLEAIEGGASLGAELPAQEAGRTLLGRATPFVGRTRELTTLEALLDESIDEPIARAVVITAAAGFGKTRLIAEFLDRVRARTRSRPAIFFARAEALTRGAPFGLLASLVRSAAQIVEGEPLTIRRQKLAAVVRDRIDARSVQRIAMGLGDLAHVPFEDVSYSSAPHDPKLRGDAMREAFLDWLGATLEREPVLLVIDDLHWGDEPSVAFLDAALREHAKKRLLLVAGGRPELHDHLGEPWVDRDAQPMRLTKLRAKAALDLARHALPDADAALIERIVDHADGNPFFLEELIRTVSEVEGATELPTTVLGMVEARLDVLSLESRRILRAASVFGRHSWHGGIVTLLGGSRQAIEVDRLLIDLQRRELIERSEVSRFEGEVEWVFRNELTRAACYETLTEEDARLGHRLAATWLEAAGEDRAVILAEHHERGGDRAAAARFWARAAEQALHADALDLAIERAERALEAASGIGASDRLLSQLTLADARRWRGDYDDAFEHAVNAVKGARRGSAAFFRALGIVFAAGGRLRRHEEVEAHRADALDAIAESDAVGLQIVALCRAATIALTTEERERFEDTMAHAEHLASTRGDGDPLARAWILTLRASASLRTGDLGGFVEGTERAVAAYDEAGDPRDACNQRVRLGHGLISLGYPERGERVLRDAVTAARRMGLRIVEGYAIQNLGHALLRRGDLEGARATLRRAVALASEVGDPVFHAGSLLYLAEVEEMSGDREGAVRDAAAAVALLDSASAFRTVASAILARALLSAGRAEEALERIREADQRRAEGSLEESEAIVDAVLIRALRANRRDAEANRALEDARARLIVRASRMSDVLYKERFLAVPIHREIMEGGPS